MELKDEILIIDVSKAKLILIWIHNVLEPNWLSKVRPKKFFIRISHICFKLIIVLCKLRRRKKMMAWKRNTKNDEFPNSPIRNRRKQMFVDKCRYKWYFPVVLLYVTVTTSVDENLGLYNTYLFVLKFGILLRYHVK